MKDLVSTAASALFNWDADFCLLILEINCDSMKPLAQLAELINMQLTAADVQIQRNGFFN